MRVDRDFWLRLLKLFFGLVLFAIGIVMTLKANIGYSPWDVFHAGLSEVTGISFGLASIIVGATVLVIVILMKETFGLGAVVNIFVIGLIIDLIMHFIPVAPNFVWGLAMLVAGLIVVAIGSYFYMSSGFGAGPRDSLMVALVRKTKKPVGVCRTVIDLTALIFGWLLGGMVGIGTIISAFGFGFCVQITFKILKFDVTAVKHESLAETVKRFIRG